MRDWGQAEIDATSGPVTTPTWLLEIELDQTYHYSTRQEVELFGSTFVVGMIKSIDSITNQELRLALWNDEYRHTMNAIDGVYMNNEVRLWYAPSAKRYARYVEEGYWQDGYTNEPVYDTPAPILYFNGFIDMIPRSDQILEIVAKQTPPQLYPRRRLRPPFANFAPSEGYTFVFDGVASTVEGRR